MSKAIVCNGINIEIAVFRGVVYMKHVAVGKALEYKNGAPTPGGEPIEVGPWKYYSLTDYENNCKANGKRGDNLRGLISKVKEQYQIQELMPACVDDIAIQWLRARDDVKTGRVILADAIARELELREEVMKGEIV